MTRQKIEIKTLSANKVVRPKPFSALQFKTSILQLKSNFAHWPYIDDTLALKAQSVPSSCTSGVKAFQSRTVLGKNDTILLFVLQRMVWKLLLVFIIGEINIQSLLMATRLLSTLYSMQRRASLVCLPGFASLSPGACHLHWICYGVCW